MTNRKTTKNESSSLVPMKHGVPAALSVGMADSLRAELSKDFNQKLNKEIGGTRNAIGAVRVFGYVSGAMAVIGIASSMPILLPALFGIVSIGANGIGVTGPMEIRDDYNKRLKEAVEGAQEKFGELQRDAYKQQKQRVLEAAEHHLESGNLIAVEDMAWLVNLDPETLKPASDKLAISVLQARRALAYMRNEALPEAERALIAPSATFATLEIDATLGSNRAYLRSILAEGDKGLAEDSLPSIQKLEFVNPPPEEKIGLARATMEYLVPFSNYGFTRKARKAELPQVKEVEILPVQPVADFAAALSAYEETRAPLDLPAMRGWKTAPRKMLPGPKGF